MFDLDVITLLLDPRNRVLRRIVPFFSATFPSSPHAFHINEESSLLHVEGPSFTALVLSYCVPVVFLSALIGCVQRSRTECTYNRCKSDTSYQYSEVPST
jgi:hypothetical protein